MQFQLDGSWQPPALPPIAPEGSNPPPPPPKPPSPRPPLAESRIIRLVPIYAATLSTYFVPTVTFNLHSNPAYNPSCAVINVNVQISCAGRTKPSALWLHGAPRAAARELSVRDRCHCGHTAPHSNRHRIGWLRIGASQVGRVHTIAHSGRRSAPVSHVRKPHPLFGRCETLRYRHRKHVRAVHGVRLPRVPARL